MNAVTHDKMIARVFPEDKLVEEAIRMGHKIASYSNPVVQMAKEAVKVSFESSLEEGLRL